MPVMGMAAMAAVMEMAVATAVATATAVRGTARIVMKATGGEVRLRQNWERPMLRMHRIGHGIGQRRIRLSE